MEYDELSNRNEENLNRQIDSQLADDSQWEMPNWKRRHWMMRLYGFIAGVVVGIAILKFFGF